MPWGWGSGACLGCGNDSGGQEIMYKKISILVNTSSIMGASSQKAVKAKG